ncbi:hypothetical protein Bca52824_032846 [Brassica carinata]|uniref:Uncharacterized protein n=1 Tax=Brassica carinata TaxID=52824 RepID=A0A8X7SEY4_BRACI|nr:hypothetical protein Bca52824_032846 [Brassica carinata]
MIVKRHNNVKLSRSPTIPTKSSSVESFLVFFKSYLPIMITSQIHLSELKAGGCKQRVQTRLLQVLIDAKVADTSEPIPRSASGSLANSNPHLTDMIGDVRGIKTIYNQATQSTLRCIATLKLDTMIASLEMRLCNQIGPPKRCRIKQRMTPSATEEAKALTGDW